MTSPSLAEIGRRLTRVEDQQVTKDVFDARMEGVRVEMQGLRTSVDRIGTEQTQNRNLIRGAIVTGMVNIIVAVILFFVLRGPA